LNVKNKAERVKKRRRRVRDNVQIAVLLVLALFFLTLCRYGWVQIVTGAEMFLGPCLITGVHPRAINLITACYLLILAGAMAQALRRGIVTECGCFGALSAERVRWRLVTRSIILSAFLAADALLGARWALASGHETAVLVPLTILTLGQFLFDVESARRHLAGNRASLP